MNEPIALMEHWQDLANAIIVKAAEDFRYTLHCLKQNPDNLYYVRQKKELERFFTSKWFGILTALDGEQLLQTLKKEAAVQ